MFQVLKTRRLSPQCLENFIVESCKLDTVPLINMEGHYAALVELLNEAKMGVSPLERYIATVAPRHTLRCEVGMNLFSNGAASPLGGPDLCALAERLFTEAAFLSSFDTFIRFEMLKPFTGANGRAGRALWLWHMLRYADSESMLAFTRDGFAVTFYRQAVEQSPFKTSVVYHEAGNFLEVVTRDCPVVWARLPGAWAEAAYAMSDRSRVVGLRVNGLAFVQKTTGKVEDAC